MSGVHINSKNPPVVYGDIVGGNKTTTIIAAGVRLPETVLEKAEEAVLDSGIAFAEATNLLKALKKIRKAKNSEDFENAVEELLKLSHSDIVSIYISEIRGEKK